MEPRIITRDSHGIDLELRENHPLRLQRARGRRIEALAGTIWITAYNECADIELRAGQSFTLPNDRLALVEAIGRGMVRIDQPAPLHGALARLRALLRPRREPAIDSAAACLPASR